MNLTPRHPDDNPKGWKSLKKQKKIYKNEGLGLSEGPLVKSSLKRDFLCPPTTVLSSRDSDWQRRKRLWLALGIQSELGREAKIFQSSNPVMKKLGETSIFDPVLCEVLYSWFCPPKGQIVDPFAGGSVRGVVASVMGYRYWGCDLNKQQIQANQQQLNPHTKGDYEPVWIQGDSLRKLDQAPACDFIFSCPPYGDLEVYSKDGRDLSNMDYEQFQNSYQGIIKKSCQILKENRFACFVVGNYRDKKTGSIRDLIGLTIQAFTNNGLAFYNDVVLLTPTSSLFRCRRIFEAGKKLVRCHQNILVFCKGRPWK